MKCPKCQNEVSDNARFCTKCGCNLEEARAAMKPNVCTKCGAALIPNAKFCTKCGTQVTAMKPATAVKEQPKPVAPVQEQPKPAAPVQEQPKPVAPVQEQPKPAAPVQEQPKPVKPVPPAPVPPKSEQIPITPVQPMPVQNEKPAKKQKEKKNSNTALVVIVIILVLLIVAAGTICFMIWKGTISLPTGGKDTETAQVQEESSEIDTSEEETTTVAVNVDELFVDADALLETGKNQITQDSEIVNGMNSLTDAIGQFTAKAQEAGDATLAADRVTDAYASYADAVVRHKDMLNGQNLSGAIYGQIMSEMNSAVALGDDLKGQGYNVDNSSLTSARDEFSTTYTDNIIKTFDEFTTRETWSRTESWNLMSETPDNMFDSSDLDNPIRLRYVYALAWWTQKQIETELTNGTITAKGAAIKIANLIDAMDYNPMMVKYYIDYMKEAKEDCSEVEAAYNDVVKQLSDTQGINIGKDIALDHFWYFNDFGTYSVDDTNGVTTENRQWIRDRMSQVTFVKQ